MAYIIDTDVGSDIDDVWALVYMLACGADIKLINVSHRNTQEKIKFIAKILLAAGRTDIPISIGPATNNGPTRMTTWAQEVDLASYPGIIHKDGVAAVREAIVQNSDAILLGLSPATTLSKIAEDPALDLSGIRLVQMAGSVKDGYDGAVGRTAEWNVREDAVGFGAVLHGGWDITLIPLDAVDQFKISGADYQKLKVSSGWAARTVLDGYKNWKCDWSYYGEDRSSNLFDIVTADVALRLAEVKAETFQFSVSSDGMFVDDPGAKSVKCVLGYDQAPLLKRIMEALV